jgi:hypothetical protein
MLAILGEQTIWLVQIRIGSRYYFVHMQGRFRPLMQMHGLAFGEIVPVRSDRTHAFPVVSYHRPIPRDVHHNTVVPNTQPWQKNFNPISYRWNKTQLLQHTFLSPSDQNSSTYNLNCTRVAKGYAPKKMQEKRAGFPAQFSLKCVAIALAVCNCQFSNQTNPAGSSRRLFQPQNTGRCDHQT